MLKFTQSATITQPWGASVFNYLRFKVTKNGGYWHDGQDEGAPTGTKYPAPESGTVTFQGYEPGGAGNYVVFKTDSGYELLIMHLSRFAGIGSKRKGEALGYVGSTGNSTGPHHHTSVYPPNRDYNNGVKGAIDPQIYLRGIEATQPTKGFMGVSAKDWSAEATRGFIYEVTGNRHTLADIRKHHLGKKRPQIEREFFASKEYEKALSDVYKLAYGRPATASELASKRRSKAGVPQVTLELLKTTGKALRK